MIPSKENNWQGQNMAGLRNDEIRLTIDGEKIDVTNVQIINVQSLRRPVPAIPFTFESTPR